MTEKVYNREAAGAYARKWALSRNPVYADFTKMGGDCTNFASQCLYAGAGVMNYKKPVGWFYTNLTDRAPAWTGVSFFAEFLLANGGEGPYAVLSDLTGLETGDFIQLKDYSGEYYHTLFCARKNSPAPKDIYICAHTNDSDMRPLSSYNYAGLRVLHISVVRA